MTKLRALMAGISIALAGCHSAGPFGHSVNYEPLGDEEKAATGAREYDPVMFQRLPDEWRAKPTALFGIVSSRGSGSGGGAYLTMTVRRLEPRNLCENANDEDTCRVTVSDRDFGIVHAVVPLRPDDDVGAHSVGIGSLLRVVGLFGQDVDPNDASPILRATYYRHWPRYTYVTRAAAQNMRQ
jgi:hypothetical protein